MLPNRLRPFQLGTKAPSVAVAIRSFAMRVLEKICRKVPELKEEVRLTIEDLMQYETAPAFTSAAKDVLKRI